LLGRKRKERKRRRKENGSVEDKRQSVREKIVLQHEKPMGLCRLANKKILIEKSARGGRREDTDTWRPSKADLQAFGVTTSRNGGRGKTGEVGQPNQTAARESAWWETRGKRWTLVLTVNPSGRRLLVLRQEGSRDGERVGTRGRRKGNILNTSSRDPEDTLLAQ